MILQVRVCSRLQGCVAKEFQSPGSTWVTGLSCASCDLIPLDGFLKFPDPPQIAQLSRLQAFNTETYEGTANIQIMVCVLVKVGSGVTWVTGWRVATLVREE